MQAPSHSVLKRTQAYTAPSHVEEEVEDPGMVPRKLSTGWCMADFGNVNENAGAEFYIQMRAVSKTKGSGWGPAGKRTCMSETCHRTRVLQAAHSLRCQRILGPEICMHSVS